MIDTSELSAAMELHQIPEYMRGGLLRWIEHAIEPGEFLRAVLRNDLRQACELADDNNRERLAQYLKVLYSSAPGGCWGSIEKYERWRFTHSNEFRELSMQVRE